MEEEEAEVAEVAEVAGVVKAKEDRMPHLHHLHTGKATIPMSNVRIHLVANLDTLRLSVG